MVNPEQNEFINIRLDSRIRLEEIVWGGVPKNGILDLTLKLIPQGSALAEPDDSDDDNRPDEAEDDDEEEEKPDVSIDFGDEDDDEDDGGIPIV